jgi:hypothetical protein
MSTRFNTTRTTLLLAGFALMLPCGAAQCAQQTQAQVKITGADGQMLVLSAHELKTIPRATVRVANSHNKKTEVYEGVAPAELLRRAGILQGESLRGQAMAWYVVRKRRTATVLFFRPPNSIRPLAIPTLLLPTA